MAVYVVVTNVSNYVFLLLLIPLLLNSVLVLLVSLLLLLLLVFFVCLITCGVVGNTVLLLNLFCCRIGIRFAVVNLAFLII